MGKWSPKTDKQGNRKGYTRSLPNVQHRPVNLCDRNEELLRKLKTQQAVTRPKRNPDEQSINWDAFGGDKGRLESSPIIKTKVNIKRKRYKPHSML